MKKEVGEAKRNHLTLEVKPFIVEELLRLKQKTLTSKDRTGFKPMLSGNLRENCSKMMIVKLPDESLKIYRGGVYKGWLSAYMG